MWALGNSGLGIGAGLGRNDSEHWLSDPRRWYGGRSGADGKGRQWSNWSGYETGAVVSGLVPSYIINASYSWFKFVVKALVGIVLLAIGIVFTDLGEVARSITPQYVFLCALVVFGAAMGAGLAGRLVGFYFIESAITAGLCMTNMGGTGDVAVLSASKRMQLMPFARLSTSIGGALIIFLCGLLASYLHKN